MVLFKLWKLEELSQGIHHTTPHLLCTNDPKNPCIYSQFQGTSYYRLLAVSGALNQFGCPKP